MSMTRAVARPLLSSIFVISGAEAVRHPETKVKVAEPVAKSIAERVPALPQDTETLVRLNGAVMVGAGTLLALGKFRRLASLALIGTLVPTTYAGHRFWEETDDAARAQQRIHFLKNLGLLGGLILCLVDTEGKPSLGWKARRSAKRAGLAFSSGKGRAGRRASSSAHEAAVNIEELLAVAAATGGRAGRKARKAAEAASLSMAQSSAAAGHSSRRAARRASASMAQSATAATAATGRAARRARRSLAKADLKAQKAALKKAQKSALRAQKAALLKAEKAAARAEKAAQRSRAAAEPVIASGVARAQRGIAAAEPVLSEGLHRAQRSLQAAEPVLTSGVQRAQRGIAAAEPVLTTGVQRAGEAWSSLAEHLPVG
jgi:uncharacterized membrane protein YphA (DoxX/SURF4 family)